MYDAVTMRVFQRFSDLHCAAQRLPGRHRSSKRFSLNILHHEVVGADIVERTDVRMIQGCDGAGLSSETIR